MDKLIFINQISHTSLFKLKTYYHFIILYNKKNTKTLGIMTAFHTENALAAKMCQTD